VATIGSQPVPSGFTLPTTVYTITPASQPHLNPNTDYWIQAVFNQDPVTGGLPQWDRNDPSIAPSSPSGWATFTRYDFYDPSTNTHSTSGTYNAIVVRGSTVATAPLSSGSATRTILTGSSCGGPITPLDTIAGGFGVDVLKSVEFDHVGFATAGTILAPTGLRVGTLVSTHNWIATLTGTPLGVGTGAARAVAFGEFQNNTASALSVGAGATLTGDFPIVSGTYHATFCGSGGSGVDATFSGGSAGHATAAVYVFDAQQFLTAVSNSGQTIQDFLLGADTLADYQAGTRSSLSLSNLSSLSGAVIADDFVAGIDHTSTLPLNLGPGLFVVPPGRSVIVVFDISAYAPPGATVQLIRTLKPAPGFMAGMTSVGPWTADPLVPANLALAPAATSNPITTPVTLTATVTASGGAPVPNAIVSFEFIGGPNGQPPATAIADAAGHATFTYAGGPNAGIDQIKATIGALQSNVADITWTSPGPLHHIGIAPASATIGAGGSQSYIAQSFDVFGQTIADVTAGTTFTISPDGSCTGPTCTASVAGTHTVTGAYNGKTAAATLGVTPVVSTFTFQGFFNPIDMSTASLVVWNTVKAGQAVPVKWVLTQNGAPVSDPASFAGLLSYPTACSSGAGSIDDAIDQSATGASGLQYNGDGNWQINWKTLASYKNTCRAVVVKFSDGTTSPPANFKFK
jgi:hypothetical protein